MDEKELLKKFKSDPDFATKLLQRLGAAMFANEHLETRQAHYDRFFGSEGVIVAHGVNVPHIDVFQYPPQGKRTWWTLITGGMGDQRQELPDNTWYRAELLMYVHEPKPWMLNVLEGVARCPFENNTFFHWWHTIPNGMPMTAEPSLLTAFYLMPPCKEAPEFDQLTLEGDPVRFLWVVPITEAELAFAYQHKEKDALGKLLEDISFVVDESRASVA